MHLPSLRGRFRDQELGLKKPDIIPRLFAHLTCAACLLLQRFGFITGAGSQVCISLLLLPAAFAGLICLGYVRVTLTGVLLFLILLLSLLVTTFLAILFPDFSYRFSLTSFAEFIFLYLLLTLSPSRKFDIAAILPAFVFWSRVIAAAGVFQYAFQFAGLRLFSFGSLLPLLRPFLIEQNYHVVAPISYGSSILRSNGLFMLEPSMFSQLMALAIIVEGFVRRSYRWLLLYATALAAAQSGTGPLILATAFLTAALLTPGQSFRLLVVAAIGAGAAIAVALIFPLQSETLIARAGGNDPSSQLRYAGQLQVLHTIITDHRLLLGFGPGAEEGFAVNGTSSAALKMVFDYGFLGLTTFTMFFIVRTWRQDAPILSIGCLALFQLGGGYLLFPPFVLLIAVLCIWGRGAEVQSARVPRFGWSRTSFPSLA